MSGTNATDTTASGAPLSSLPAADAVAQTDGIFGVFAGAAQLAKPEDIVKAGMPSDVVRTNDLNAALSDSALGQYTDQAAQHADDAQTSLAQAKTAAAASASSASQAAQTGVQITTIAKGVDATASQTQGIADSAQQALTGVTADANAAKVLLSAAINGNTSLEYKGYWDANTNTPTLASGVGEEGSLYIVSTAGATNLDGNVDWSAEDGAWFTGGKWVYFARAGWAAVAQVITALSGLRVGDARVLGVSAGGALEIVDSLGALICVINPDGSWSSSLYDGARYEVGKTGLRAGPIRILDDGATSLRIVDPAGAPLLLDRECIEMPKQELPVTQRYPGAYDDAQHYYASGDVWQHNARVWQCLTANAGRALWTQLQDVPPLPVDRFGASVVGAYGTRRMASGYTGPMLDVLVQKSGVKSIVTIGQDARGVVDPLSLQGAAAGIDSKTFLWVVRVYDQTGNGNHLTAPGYSGGIASIPTINCPRIGVRRDGNGIDLISWCGAPQAAQSLVLPAALSLSAGAATLLCYGAVSSCNSPAAVSYTLASLGSSSGETITLGTGGNTESGRVSLADYDPSVALGTSTLTLNTDPGVFGASFRGGDYSFVHGMFSGVLSNPVKLASGFSQRTFVSGAIGATLFGGSNAVANSVAMQLSGIILCNRGLSDGEIRAASIDAAAAFNYTPQKRIRLDCIGSSTTQGYLNLDGWCWPQMLADYTAPMEVRSWAVPGSTASDFLAGTIGSVLSDSAVKTRKFAITWLGNNDLTAGQSIDTIIANNASIHKQLRAAGYERLFILAQYDTSLNVAVFNAVNSGVIDADALIDPFSFAPMNTRTNGQIYHDGTHPTDAGDRVIASVIARTLEKYT